MNHSIVMNVYITTYDRYEPMCRLYQKIDNEPFKSYELTMDQARKMMWELKLAGGTKTVEPHPYSSTICTRRVNYRMSW